MIKVVASVSSQEEIHWKLSRIRHGRWEENDDPTQESCLTFQASVKLSTLIEVLEHYLVRWCPQDIGSFKIVDKSYGEISLQWYGLVLELDIDIEDDGKLSFLLSRTGTLRETWISEEDTTVDSLIVGLNSIQMVNAIPK